MDLTQVGALVSGGGVLAFAAVVLVVTSRSLDKLERRLDKALEILRALEERTAAPVPPPIPPERTAQIRKRLRTNPLGHRIRPGRDTTED